MQNYSIILSIVTNSIGYIYFGSKILDNDERNIGTPNPIKYINIATVGINSWKKFVIFPCIVHARLPQLEINSKINI